MARPFPDDPNQVDTVFVLSRVSLGAGAQPKTPADGETKGDIQNQANQSGDPVCPPDVFGRVFRRAHQFFAVLVSEFVREGARQGAVTPQRKGNRPVHGSDSLFLSPSSLSAAITRRPRRFRR